MISALAPRNGVRPNGGCSLICISLYQSSTAIMYSRFPLTRATVWVGRPVIADNANLTLTLVGINDYVPPSSPAVLEVYNPTDRENRAELSSPKGTPVFVGWTDQVTVPAGDLVLLDVPRQMVFSFGSGRGG